MANEEKPGMGFERRRNDRRKSERPGKHDRRKNTCGACQYYTEQSAEVGMCQKHQHLVKLTDFACIWFAPQN